MLKTRTLIRILLASLMVVLIGCGRHQDDGFVATVKGLPPVVSHGTLIYRAPLSDRLTLSRDGLIPASVTALRFRGLDTGGVPVFGPVTLKKAATLTLDQVPTSVDRLAVELLAQDQIVAATLLPVRVSSTRPGEVKNPYFFTQAPQGVGEGKGGEGGGHAYIYHLATLTRATIAAGADIPLSTNGPAAGVAHREGQSGIVVANDGIYLVEYRAHVSSGIGASIALAINGQVNSSTVVPCRDSLGLIRGRAVLSLKSGDTIALRNSTTESITLPIGPKVGAQVSLIQLGP